MARTSGERKSVTARTAGWSVRHRWTVAGAWFLILVAAVVTSSVVKTDTDTEQDFPGEAGAAARLFEDRFGSGEESSREVVVFSHPELRVDQPRYQEKVQDLMGDLRALRNTRVSDEGGTTVTSSERVVATTLTAYDIGLPRDQSPFVAPEAAGGDVSFAIVTLVGDEGEAEHHVEAVVDTVERAGDGDRFDIDIGGEASIASQSTRVIEEDFGFALQLNLPITLLLLLLAFGALVAALIPLALGLGAIMIALGVLAVVSRVYPLEELYTEMVLLIGLATGIDYSLFIVTRYRAERATGHPKEHAIVRASGTSGKAVVFAGITVLLAISGMFLVDNVVFSSMAIAAITVVAIAVVISVTLLPAELAILGHNVNRLRLGFLRRRHADTGGIWGRISDYVLARPVTITVVTLAVLLVLALPVATFNLGFNGNKALPDAVDAKKALATLENNFTLGLTSPAIVLIDPGQDQNIFGSGIQTSTDAFLRLVEEKTTSATDGDAPYGTPVQTEVNDSGNTELIRI